MFEFYWFKIEGKKDISWQYCHLCFHLPSLSLAEDWGQIIGLFLQTLIHWFLTHSHQENEESLKVPQMKENYTNAVCRILCFTARRFGISRNIWAKQMALYPYIPYSISIAVLINSPIQKTPVIKWLQNKKGHIFSIVYYPWSRPAFE